MAVFKIMGCEIEKEDIIKGAFVVTGIATIAIGVKKLFDAKDISYELEDLDEDDPEMDEFYLEEYKEQERTRLSRKMGCKVGTGVLSLVGGIAALGIGILSFTPYKRVITDRIDDVDISGLKQKLQDAAISQKISDLDLRQKISDIDLKQKISDADIKNILADIDLKDKLPDVNIKEKLIEADLRKKIQDSNLLQKLSDADLKKLAAEMIIKSKIKDMKKLAVISKIKDLIG